MKEIEIMPGSNFLDALVDELQPVRPALPWARAITIWTLASSLFVAAALLWSGPLRVGFVSDLSSLRLLGELGLGAATSLAVIAAAFEIGVPGAPSMARLLGPAAFLGASWLGLTLLGDALPGPTHSMLGKRAHCFSESLAVSLPPAGIALVLLRRRLMWAHGAAGSLVGAAAASMAALGMQLACMYEPEHALRFHFSPILLVAVAGAAAGHFFMARD